MTSPESSRLAVLIDADNASPKHLPGLVAEMARYGTLTVKRAYGDWTTSNLGGWKDELNRHAIQPVQQFAYTRGKNSTDSALIIDAMDLLFGGNVDGFCLVSSDSDFTRLATRLRESGKVVYGIGARKTPQAFVAACDKFTFVEVLRGDGSGEPGADEGGAELDVRPLRDVLTRAIEETCSDDQWANLGRIGSYISQNDPSFDARNYGFRKLGDLVRAQSWLETREETGSGGGHSLWVRMRPRAARAGAAKKATKSVAGRGAKKSSGATTS